MAERFDRMSAPLKVDDEESGLLEDLKAHRSYQSTRPASFDEKEIEKEKEADVVTTNEQDLRVIFEGIRKNAIPGIIIQVLALCIVVGYFYVGPITTALGFVAYLKATAGYFFSAASASTFGGIIPSVVMTLRDYYQFRQHQHLTGNLGYTFSWKSAAINTAFMTCLFAERGVDVDTFYRIQARLFGTGNDWLTLLKKVCVDAFVYGPFYGQPLYCFAFTFRDNNFSLRQTFQNWSWANFRFRWLSGILSGWMIWIPVCVLVYMLPGPLQLPLNNLVLCFYSLLLCFIHSRSGPPPPASTKAEEKEPQVSQA